MRLVHGLETKQFARVIPRPAANPNEQTSNEYRLLWHEVFQEIQPFSDDNLSPGSDILSPSPSGKMPPPGSDILSPKKSQSSEKGQNIKATSSDDDAASYKTLPEKATQEPPGLWEYQHQIAEFLRARSCVTTSFRRVDREFAAALFREGVPIDHIEHGVSLACWRWYGTALNGNALPPIGSLRYFANAINEAAAIDGGSGYWGHVEHRVCQFERDWLSQRKPPASEASPPQAQPGAARMAI